MRRLDSNDFQNSFIPEPNTGCWIWLGYVNNKGYAYFASKLAHRYSYLFYKEKTIPNHLTVDHICNVRCCVNPDHLRLLTLRENVLRGNLNAKKTVCVKGHPYSTQNTIYRKAKCGKQRVCRICHNVRWLAAYHRRRKKAGELIVAV